MLVEVIDNVIDQNVAVGKVFGRLHPHRPAANDATNAGARDRGIANARLQKLDRRRTRIGGKYRRLAWKRGKQGLSRIIHHGIGISPIGLRIEALKVWRELEREAAI